MREGGRPVPIRAGQHRREASESSSVWSGVVRAPPGGRSAASSLCFVSIYFSMDRNIQSISLITNTTRFHVDFIT